jgi:hypothetical protein
VTIHLPAPLPALTLSLGHQAKPAAHHPVTAQAIRLFHDAPSSRVATKGSGPLAVTTPGLISVVPIGPMPSALRPRVATESVRPAAQSGGSEAAGLSAPPIGFWFLLVLLVLMFGSTTYLVGGRRHYSVALSITKR